METRGHFGDILSTDKTSKQNSKCMPIPKHKGENLYQVKAYSFVESSTSKNLMKKK